jgi:molybdenum cofactor biosynthesis enzyme MoaA
MIYRDYLEADIVDYCNLRCKDCSHHSPYMDRSVYELDQFTEDVKNLSKALHLEKFRILGGEPLLNHDLVKYIQVLRKYNLADNIGICTNGILLDLVNEELLAQMDFLDVSLYLDLPELVKEKVLINIKILFAIDETK